MPTEGDAELGGFHLLAPNLFEGRIVPAKKKLCRAGR
jgi:hypothetical protein